jgi:hypothetical protein
LFARGATSEKNAASPPSPANAPATNGRAAPSPKEKTSHSCQARPAIEASMSMSLAFGLVLLQDDEALEHEHVHVGVHEAAVGVLGRAHDRLAAHVEAGVDDTGQPVAPRTRLRIL